MRRLPVLTSLLPLLTAAPAWADAAAPPQSYAVKVAAPEARVGQSALAVVSVLAAAGFHVNDQYPSSLTVKLPGGVDGPAGKIRPRARAADQGNANVRREASFDLPFVARESGTKQFTATARFAICDDANTQCVPRQEEVTFSVAVRSGDR